MKLGASDEYGTCTFWHWSTDSSQGEEEWYELVAKTRPPKDKPWYHFLVHEAVHTTYVSEQNLEPDLTGHPVEHPALMNFFDDFRDRIYQRNEQSN